MTTGHHAQATSRPDTPLPSSAEVVVIGGGVIGTSVAAHLARAGSNVVILERDTLGSGSSAKPLGGVRATFSEPGNITLGQRSLESYERFASEWGTDIGLHQVGYLFVCRTEKEAAAVEQSVLLQNRLGGSSRMVTPSEAVTLSPYLDPGVVVAASHSPRDGFAEPARVVAGYAADASRRGVVICDHVAVVELEQDGAGVGVVHTTRGSIRAQIVVIAAGAWSGGIGRMAGVTLPITPVRRQIGFTGKLAPAPPVMPFTIDLGSTLYYHNAGDGLLLGISDPDQEPGFDRDFTHDWLPAFDRAASIVAPSLVGSRLAGGWAGLYEDTPDRNALIGKATTPENLYYAAGFSGHGFLQAPAVGELLSDLILDRPSFMDVSSFSADRFERAAALSEVHII